jgi:hypothetical protein
MNLVTKTQFTAADAPKIAQKFIFYNCLATNVM